MKAGKLNQRITLYRTVAGKSSSGAPTDLLEKLATTWAELVSGSSSQSANNDREQPHNGYQWRLRWRDNIESGYWLQWGDRWMKITGVNDFDPRRRELLLDAESNPKSTPPPINSESAL